MTDDDHDTEGGVSVQSATGRLLTLSGVISGAILALMAAMIFVTVFSRYFFGNPLSELFQLVEYSLLCVPILSAAWLANKNGHVRVEIVGEYVTQQTNRHLDTLSNILAIGVCAFIAMSASIMASRDVISGQTTPGLLDLPRWPFMALIATGFILYGWQQLIALVKRWNER